MDDLMLPEPAFRLKWKDGAYYVSKPSIGDTDVFTAEQMREYAKKAVEAERADYQRLMEKHNNLHMNAKAHRDRIAALEGALTQAVEVLENSRSLDPVEIEWVKGKRLAVIRTARLIL